MRCPKCHYISYDSTERCRNCGYEFSLSADSAELELPIQTGDEAIGPLTDLPLDQSGQHVPAVASAIEAAHRARARREPAFQSEAARGLTPQNDPEQGRRGISPPRDLPLFKDGDAPLVSAPVYPRPPLSVRRATPVARDSARTPSDAPVLNLEMHDRHVRVSRAESASPDQSAAAGTTPQLPSGASAVSRLAAAFVDLIILGSIDALVLYFTLKICGLELFEIVVLPPVPLLAFLLLLDGGYLVAFTAASGQTIGKMAAGIRVVPATDGADRVPAHHAALRAVAYLVSVLPAGLGLLPALFGADRRTIHDRLADTRVVKA